MSGLSLDQTQQVQHIAQMALFAMCARAVAGAEFDCSPEVGALRFTITRTRDGGESPIDAEFLSFSNQPIGGMSL